MSEPETNHETYFFRHPQQLQSIVDFLCRPQQRRGPAQRVWSAGCSLGAEPYSLAMLVECRRRVAEDFPLTIWATDRAPAIIQQAREAVFGAWYLRHCPDIIRQRYFESDGSRARLDRQIVRQVEFFEHDLELGSRLGGSWDVIVCRNLLMYYDRAQQRRMVDSLVDQLREGGLLAVGVAESSCLAQHPELDRQPVGLSLFRKLSRNRPRSRPIAPPQRTARRERVPEPATLGTLGGDALGELRAAADYAEMDQPEAARRALKRCLYLAPAMSAAHLQLGLLERSQGRLREAQRSFRNAWQLASQSPAEEPVPGLEDWTHGQVASLARRMLDV